MSLCQARLVVRAGNGAGSLREKGILPALDAASDQPKGGQGPLVRPLNGRRGPRRRAWLGRSEGHPARVRGRSAVVWVAQRRAGTAANAVRHGLVPACCLIKKRVAQRRCDFKREGMRMRYSVSQCARTPLWTRVFWSARILGLRGFRFADMLDAITHPAEQSSQILLWRSRAGSDCRRLPLKHE